MQKLLLSPYLPHSVWGRLRSLRTSIQRWLFISLWIPPFELSSHSLFTNWQRLREWKKRYNIAGAFCSDNLYSFRQLVVHKNENEREREGRGDGERKSRPVISEIMRVKKQKKKSHKSCQRPGLYRCVIVIRGAPSINNVGLQGKLLRGIT